MDPPLLKLVFVKGPREGETLEYKPGSTIRVGRIVRGNNLTIREAGISEKHFRIWSDSGKWIIQDMGSSNGTFLNSDDSCLPPDTPFDLRHGDIIKFGDYTSIQVNCIDDVYDATDDKQEHNLPPRPRRNIRRQAVTDLDPVESVREKPSQRGRPPKLGNGRVLRNRIVEDTVEDVTNLEEKANSRVRRSRMKETSGNSCLDGKLEGISFMIKQDEMQKEKEEKRGNSRVRRNRKVECAPISWSDTVNLENEEIPEGLEVLEGKDGRRVSHRATRSKKIENEQNLCLGLANVEIGNTATEGAADASEKKDEKRVNLRVTRSRKHEIAQESYLDLGKVENEVKKRRRGRKKMKQNPLESTGGMTIEDNGSVYTGEEAPNHIVKGENCDAVGKGRDYRSKDAYNEAVKDSCIKEEGAKDSSVKIIDRAKVDLQRTALGEEARNCSTRKDTENEQEFGLPEECRDAIDKGRDFRTADGCSQAANDLRDKEEGAMGSGAKRVDLVEIDSKKKTLGEEAQYSIVEENIKKEEDLGLDEYYHVAINKRKDYMAKDASCEAANDKCDEGLRGSVAKNVNQMKVDLEKTTLGEWFDFLEVHLSKQIMEETEKMIEAMRSKHKRVCAYIEEQKKVMGKKPVG